MADADALPSNEKVNPAAPNAGMAALVRRFEACFTCGMVASSVSFYVASVRSTGPARKVACAIKCEAGIEFLFIFMNEIDTWPVLGCANPISHNGTPH